MYVSARRFWEIGAPYLESLLLLLFLWWERFVVFLVFGPLPPVYFFILFW